MSASMDLKLAYLTQKKMEQEAHKKQQNLVRLVSLCNTLDLYSKRLQNIHLIIPPATHVHISSDNHGVHDRATSNEESRDCVSEETDCDADGDHDDNDSDEYYYLADASEWDPTPDESPPNCHMKQSALFQLRRLNRSPIRQVVDNELPRPLSSGDQRDRCIQDDGEHNGHHNPHWENDLKRVGEVHTELSSYPNIRPVPREMYQLAELTF